MLTLACSFCNSDPFLSTDENQINQNTKTQYMRKPKIKENKKFIPNSILCEIKYTHKSYIQGSEM